MKVILVYAWAAHPGVHKLADTLSRNGYDVRLLLWDRDGIYPKVEKIHSFTAFRFHYKAPWGKLAALLYFPIWWIYELYFLWREHPDIVHACNFSTLPPAIIMKLVMRIKVCYTIYDLFGMVYPGSMPSAARNMARLLERVGIGFADILFLVSESYFEDISSARIKKLVYIYNSPEDYLDVQVSPEYKSETCIF